MQSFAFWCSFILGFVRRGGRLAVRIKTVYRACLVRQARHTLAFLSQKSVGD